MGRGRAGVCGCVLWGEMGVGVGARGAAGQRSALAAGGGVLQHAWASARLWSSLVSAVMFSAGMLGACSRSIRALVLAGLAMTSTYVMCVAAEGARRTRVCGGNKEDDGHVD